MCSEFYCTGYCDDNPTMPTCVNISSIIYANNYYNNTIQIQQIKKETNKEKIQRIAKERMKASWNIHNEKFNNVIEIKQQCNHKHKKIKNKNYSYLN